MIKEVAKFEQLKNEYGYIQAYNRALLYIKDYLKRYNPAGYNTEVESITLKNEYINDIYTRYYEVVITRFSSCD